MQSLPEQCQVPSIRRRLAAMPYEILLVMALLLFAALPLAGFNGASLQAVPHVVAQAYLLSVTCLYFVWCWRKGGQTLAMKTWRFRVVSDSGQPMTVFRAMARFGCTCFFLGPAWVGMLLLFFPKHVSPVIAMWAFLPMIATILWARFDPDRQFLHDRMAGTRLVSAGG